MRYLIPILLVAIGATEADACGGLFKSRRSRRARFVEYVPTVRESVTITAPTDCRCVDCRCGAAAIAQAFPATLYARPERPRRPILDCSDGTCRIR